MPLPGWILRRLRAALGGAASGRAALAEAEARACARAAAEEEFLRHAVAELDKLNPEPGEEASPGCAPPADAGRRARIREDIARAHAALSDDGAEGRMRDAMRWLDGAADRAEGRLDAPLAALNRALIELGEAQAGVERALGGAGVRSRRAGAVEERLFAIRALARKHGVLADDLGGFADGLRARLAAIDGGAAGLHGWHKAVAEAEAGFTAEAATDSARAQGGGQAAGHGDGRRNLRP